METLISEIGSWMINLPSIAVFTIIMTLIFFVFFKETLNSKLKKINFSSLNIFSRSNDHKIPLLIDHDIFNVIERVRQITKHTSFDTHGEYDAAKSKMFHDFMDFKLDIIHTSFKKYLKKIPKDISMDALKNSIFIMAGDIVEDYLHKTEEHFLKKGITPEDTDYVLMLFEQWRAETIDSVSYRINSIFASTAHPGKFEKLLGALEAFSMAIDLIPKDGIASFEEMNGKFKDLEY